jgi:hypothetical protein
MTEAAPVNPTPAPDPKAAPVADPKAPPAADPKTVVSDPPLGDADPEPKEPVAATWPDDWREQLAGGDEKELKRLQRFTSPLTLRKSHRALEQKLSSGELKKALGPDATPEEVAAWRKDMGVPEKPDGYDLKFDNGLVIGEDDKPLVAAFLTAMHAENATPSQVKAGVAAYYKIQEQQQADRAQKDAEVRAAAEDDLRAEWGVEYRRNVGMVQALLATVPEEARDLFASARLADGTPMFSHPDMLRFFVGLQREINPAATLVPNTGNQAQTIDNELSDLKAKMGDRDSDYWKGPKAEAMQARYRALLDAKAKMAARAA